MDLVIPEPAEQFVLTSTGVILQTAEGRVLVPGMDFGRTASILIGEEG